MEGSYSKVWQLCSNVAALPRPEFEFFVSTLVGTVRNEIASCQERSYATLPLSNAKTLLFFGTEGEVKEFGTAVCVFSRLLPPSPLLPHFVDSFRFFPTLHTDFEDKLIQRGWHIEGSVIHFASSPLLATKGIRSTLSVGLEDKELDKQKVVRATLGYARELESIV